MKTKINKSIFEKSSTLLFVIIASALTGFGQGTYQIREVQYNNSNEIYSVVPGPNWEKANVESLPSILKEVYGLSHTPDLTLTSEDIEIEYTFRNYQQAYGSAIVYGSDIIIKRDKNNKILVIVGTLRDVESLETGPFIGEENAIDKGIEKIGENAPYLWLYPMEEDQLKFVTGDTSASYYPKAKLVYYPRESEPYTNFVMCYEMEIHTAEPARYFTYINASSGELVHKYNGIAHANGIGTTLYNGRKAIVTSKQNDTLYFLEDSTRKIFTRDYRSTKTTYWPFYDENNDYTHNADKQGVSAHWAAIKTYDYYKTKFDRTSVDDKGKKIVQRVKYDSSYNNAFWNGQVMTYGSGDGVRWGPLVAVDDVGHETTHGTIEFAAGLIYQGESGALNEGWADIFGMTIEAYTGDKDWTQSEDSYTPGRANDALRTMNNPKTNGDPDTYEGTNWKPTSADSSDHGGVHSNSGVANFWFFLITDGKNGTNDKNEQYNVTGIGLAKAEKIAYLALDKYMSTSTDYAGARIATLLAAEDLYGKKSNEYKQVCNAWYAVNVGDKCCDTMEFEFKYKEPLCHDSKDGEIDLIITKGGTDPYEYKWYKNDTLGPVISTSEDIAGLEKGNYVVLVKDTAAKCEKTEKAKLEGPEELSLSISGGGIHIRACDRKPEIYLQATAAAGTSPYTYNWPNGKKVIAQSGSVGTSGFFTAIATDKNGCKTQRTTYAFFIPIRCSYDPNDIIGPPSYGEQKWVSVKATLPYKIRFENDPKFATAPAQKVTIDHPLDSNTDLSSFRLGNFGFGSYNFEVTKNSSFYSKRIDLRDSLGIYLDVTAGLNLSAKKAFWIFESIDPATGQPPSNANVGFLPVNDTTTHVGEGFVDYTIKPLSTASTGDSIRAIAEIVFDNNPSLLTPRIHNLIDAVPPTSGIKSRPSLQDSVNITVEMFGTDDTAASGFATWDLYISQNRGAYSLYAQGLEDSLIVYRGDYGNEYSFYTIGLDNAGNREETKNSPDLTVTIAPDQFLRNLDSNISLCARDTLTIKWNRLSITSFDLQYTSDDSTFYTVATGLDPTDSIYNWIIPESISGKKDYWIRAVTGNNGIPIDSTMQFELKAVPGVNLGNDTFFCYGTSFSFTLNQTGGTYSSYLWGNGDTTRTYSAADTGTYSLKVTNSYNCSSTDEITIGHYMLPVVAYKNIADVSCYNGNDGSIVLTVVSGNAPYYYVWDNGDSTKDISGLSNGRYIVGITDSVQCTISDTTFINQPTQIASSPAVKHVSCYNGSDAEIDLNMSGGTAPYSFVWSNSDSTEKITNLGKGTYTVIVTDTNNCVHYDTFTINEPSLLTISQSITHVSCFGNSNGVIDLSVSGGTSGYQYAWSNGDTIQDIMNLTKGTYSVVVTDANGCTAYDTSTINEPSQLNTSVSIKHVSCNAGTNGSVDLTVTGGTTPYAYIWNTTDTAQDINGLSAGTYTVQITDVNNCVIHDTAVITEPSALSISHTVTNVLCNQATNGSVNLTVSGGTTAYSFAWSSGDTTEDISAKSAGTYTVLLTDANACTIRDTALITEPSAITSSGTLIHVKCNGNSDAAIDLSVSGGSPGYAYLWSNSATTQDVTGLSAGTYSVRITDSNNCVQRDTFTITQPGAISISKQVTDISCYGFADGKVDITISGGATPYAYAWSNADTTQDVQGLNKGTYSVVITDANGCAANDTSTINEPSQMSTSLSISHVSCNAGTNGSVDLTVTGGTTPYAYVWNTADTTQDISSLSAGTYTVQITDLNNCVIHDTAVVTEPSALSISNTVTNVLCNQGTNGSVNLTVNGGTTPYSFAWSSGDTTEDISAKNAGTYAILVTDANACTIRDTALITEPTAVTSSGTISHVKCDGNSDGAIDLSVSGGSPGYAYLWSNSATTQDITGLSAGTFSVRITDSNNCVHRDTFTITQPGTLAISKQVTDITCNGFADGLVNITVSGGTTPYAYVWSNADTTQDIQGLNKGTYTIVVTDANGCTSYDTSTISEPTLLSATVSINHVSCNAGTDGLVDLTVSGGTTPYTYVWNTSDTTQDINGLIAGTYFVTITDDNGCIRTDTFGINEPAVISVTAQIKHVSCYGLADGSINLTVGGGTTPYAFAWSNGDTTEDISNLTMGTYFGEVSDANNCQHFDTFNITQPAAIALSHVNKNLSCNSDGSGEINLTIQGGTPGYSVLWNNGDTTEDITNLQVGTYIVNVTDANNCQLNDTAIITQPDSLVATHIKSDLLCFGDQSGSVDMSITGGTLPYEYAWNTGDTTQDLTNLAGGDYTVIVSDANNCQYFDSISVLEPSELILSLDSIPEIENQQNGKAWVTVTGGSGPYIYQWDDPANSTTDTAFNLSKGTYTVVVTDANGCEKTDNITIQSVLSINGMVLTRGVMIYPNPNDGAVNIYGLTELGETVTLVVSDMRGGVVVKMTLKQMNKYRLEIPETVMEGTYLISLYGNSSTAHKKIILLR